jgi:hypothetical protein
MVAAGIIQIAKEDSDTNLADIHTKKSFGRLSKAIPEWYTLFLIMFQLMLIVKMTAHDLQGLFKICWLLNVCMTVQHCVIVRILVYLF